jgi:anti-sigma regulatory factor (Ser/Thr protein kinase)
MQPAVMSGTMSALAESPARAKVSLPGQPASVPIARRFVRDVLNGCPRPDDLALAATELAANAVVWSASGEGGTFAIQVRTAPRWARGEVSDSGPADLPGPPGNGWGLCLVRAVTDRAGTTHGPGRPRTAWAEVTWPASGTP